MSTATTAQQHHLSRPVALAAAATVVVVGGLTALGVSLQNDSSSPSTPQVQNVTQPWKGCNDPTCLSGQQQNYLKDLQRSEKPAGPNVNHPTPIQPPGGLAGF
jgi:hypothetical protein